MENFDALVGSIANTLIDYRADEGNSEFRITSERIIKWITQFEEKDWLPILREMDSIFKQRYYSKSSVVRKLVSLINALSEEYHMAPNEFLKNSVFLSLQEDGKSQGKMLELLAGVLLNEFHIKIEECGSKSPKHTIYLDDILCTGTTLYTNLRKWAAQEFSSGISNQVAVEQGTTTLIVAYIFLHKKNYYKKVKQLKIEVSDLFGRNIQKFAAIEIDNDGVTNSRHEVIFPLEEGQNEMVHSYKEKIDQEIKDQTSAAGEYFRPVGSPKAEKFFTDSSNRIIVENAFLVKGIEILESVNSQIPNIRALGYAIKSHRNFGFGALCFTWRNVPNNAPLVFWYKGRSFEPLFKVRRKTGGIGNNYPEL